MVTETRTLTDAEAADLIRIGGISLEGHTACGCGVCCRMTRVVLGRLLVLRGVPVATIDLSAEPVAIWTTRSRRRRKKTT
jgi:hypothetical protein